MQPRFEQGSFDIYPSEHGWTAHCPKPTRALADLRSAHVLDYSTIGPTI